MQASQIQLEEVLIPKIITEVQEQVVEVLQMSTVERVVEVLKIV